eukprot:scaffold24098_cov48-Cyclotella_meneghiniana.AAC.2
MNSNLILVPSFIMLTMRHWNNPAAVIWIYRPTPSRSTGAKGWVDPCPNCPHPQLKSQLVVTDGDNEFQSHPCFTIHYAHNKTLEQSSCCDMDIQTHTVKIYWCERLG